VAEVHLHTKDVDVMEQLFVDKRTNFFHWHFLQGTSSVSRTAQSFLLHGQ